MTTYFESGSIKVTSEKLVSGNTVVPISMISSCVTFREPLLLGVVVINAAMFVGGVIALLSFSVGGLVLSVPLLALGGFNVKSSLLGRKYLILGDLHNGNKFEIKVTDAAVARDAFIAIQTARKA